MNPSMKQKFNFLKTFSLQNTDATLAIVKERKNNNRESVYKVKYVKITGKLEDRLLKIIQNKIDSANTFEQYNYDSPEPEEDLVNGINFEETDFYRIYNELNNLDPEIDVIETLDELIQAKAYLIIVRNDTGIKLVGFKTIPENWKMKSQKGLIPLRFKDNVFEDIEEGNVFNIASTVDFIFYDEILFILSKKNFESGLNFRSGMLAKAGGFFEEVRTLNLIVNLDVLEKKVGNNVRYLRKIATIKNLGHYNNSVFLQRLSQISLARNWGIEFNSEGQLVITEEKLDDILTVLQNKRLHSDLTDETFDVDNAKPFESYLK